MPSSRSPSDRSSSVASALSTFSSRLSRRTPVWVRVISFMSHMVPSYQGTIKPAADSHARGCARGCVPDCAPGAVSEAVSEVGRAGATGNDPRRARSVLISGCMQTARDITGYRRHWAERFGTAPFLPMSRAEMDILGWDNCDVIIVSGDAYVDHPGFGMAIIGRVLEAQGFRVGIIAQPNWHSADAFAALGRPNLFFGITAGNMDSMVNRYTSDRKMRSDDAYTPGGMAGKRPDRSVIVYAQRAREAYRDVPIVIGGIEASLRRIAHYDHWSEKVRRSVLVDSQADLLLYGNAERALVEVAHRLAARKPITSITDIRGTTFFCDGVPEGWKEIDSTTLDTPGRAVGMPNPYLKQAGVESDGTAPVAPP